MLMVNSNPKAFPISSNVGPAATSMSTRRRRKENRLRMVAIGAPVASCTA